MPQSVITSLCYFPPSVFFKYYLSAESVIADAHEYFVKQTLRNRAYLCGANGIFSLIIPIKHTGGKLTAMKDIQISYDTSWQKTHWRSIVSAYRNSPYFEYYEDNFAAFFLHREKFLFDLNLKIIQYLFSITGIESSIKKTDTYSLSYPQQLADLRSYAEPKVFFNSEDSKIAFPYQQVFAATSSVITGLSILDLIFNCGPHARVVLEDVTMKV
jgi:hypothetical protein